MSIFEGLNNAPTFERGQYMNPGIYDVRINRVLAKNTQSSGLATIVEMEIVNSTSRPQDDPKGLGRTWNPTPVGVHGTWFQGMTNKNVALPAIKSFVYAVLGLRSNDSRVEVLESMIPGSEHWPTNTSRRPISYITNLMDHAIGEGNILAGLCVHLECSMIATQSKREDFTLYNFTPADFASLRLAPPNLEALLTKVGVPAGASYAPPTAMGWSSPGGAGAPPARGASAVSAPPAQLPPPGPGWGPALAPTAAAPGWAASPAPAVAGPGWGAPPPPLPPMPAVRPSPTWSLPPGGHMSPDGKQYWAPGMTDWVPIPPADIPF